MQTTNHTRGITKKSGRNMTQAIWTGVLLVCGLIAVIMFLPPYCFTILLILSAVLGVHELRFAYAQQHIHLPFFPLYLSSILIPTGTYLVNNHWLGLLLSFTLTTLITLIITPFTIKNTTKTPLTTNSITQHLTTTIFIELYVSLLSSLLIIALFRPHYQPQLMMLLFIPACSDTGGLFFGMKFGKHKLSPHISPKKSYEGLLGSIIFAIIGTLIFYTIFYTHTLLSTFWWQPFLYGLSIALAGTYGDLSISMIKRDLSIKDLGNLLKGHGGILDRVDSILLSVPVGLLLFSWFTL
ncbi:MAG: phosphatidate cytidylyltransferase [Aeriscardovia sp.]|nr:phosphatidate cytidylyltransferase [Aeriscardovia sp.]